MKAPELELVTGWLVVCRWMVLSNGMAHAERHFAAERAHVRQGPQKHGYRWERRSLGAQTLTRNVDIARLDLSARR